MSPRTRMVLLVLQLVAVALGIWGGIELFDAASS